jgi:hypothetical protein
MPFDNEKLVNKKELLKNKKLSKDKVKRPPQKSIQKTCSNCSKKFDFNKAYPAGVFDSTTNVLLCNKCQCNRPR